MQTRIAGAWTGWSGDTIVKLANGTVWRQDQYYYRYQYKYRPSETPSSFATSCVGFPQTSANSSSRELL
ncbi:hypothetical protein H7H48_08450 [Nitratireductor sp. B36]|uniref:hypothetical protein n=1 Tax=Nitratireductor TaxID=245876 RepID=UPI001E4F6500|nr:hypothetical protein [Nitratireductor sp. B36]MCC5779079.1 hypothetical protein [Nitratireductor sp. B36]